MEEGSCDLATAMYHLEVSRDYWRELLKEERNLDALSADYSLCLVNLRRAAAELAEHRREGLRLEVDSSRLSSLRRNLLVDHEMLPRTVRPVRMKNMDEIERDEETITLEVEDLLAETYSQEATTAVSLKAHRLAVQKLSARVHGLDAYQKRQAVGEMLRQTKVLFGQIHAKYEEVRVRLRHTLQQIVDRPVENNKIRATNESLSSFIHNLQRRERTAAPTQEGGVESQMRPQNWTMKLCYSWEQVGACIHGDQCRFVHGKQELQHRIPRHPFYKTKPCSYFFSRSGCMDGENCRYLHVKQDEQEEVPILPRPIYKIKPCFKFLSRSGCKNGDNCSYLHVKQEQEHPMPLDPLYRTRPCVNFLSPWGCKNGDSCCFLHGSLPPE